MHREEAAQIADVLARPAIFGRGALGEPSRAARPCTGHHAGGHYPFELSMRGKRHNHKHCGAGIKRERVPMPTSPCQQWFLTVAVCIVEEKENPARSSGVLAGGRGNANPRGSVRPRAIERTAAS